MKLYCKITLSTLVASQPETLPPEVTGLDDVTLSDPPRYLDPPPPNLKDSAFWPADITEPGIDPRREKLLDSYLLAVRDDVKRITAIREKRDLTDEEKAALPPLQFAVLGKGDFLDLVLSTGVELSAIRAAAEDEALGDFWFALDRFYSQVRRDHEFTKRGLDGMVALGHITREQADKAMDTWPVLPS